jgi:maltose alpha-D-glucosyltransferase/alpha-amylase
MTRNSYAGSFKVKSNKVRNGWRCRSDTKPKRILKAKNAHFSKIDGLDRHSPSWLQKAVFYQVYPQSFFDTNGDGIGDLAGIIAKLDYIKSLGCTAIWLNPVFDSPFGDAGYDIRDFIKIAPRYGTNIDAEQLFKEAHRRNLRVVFDLVAGHTSTQHPWFIESAKTEPNAYTGFYQWVPASEPGSVAHTGGRSDHFKKNFFEFQPALYYGSANPDPAKPWERGINDPQSLAVRKAMRGVMKFWLDLGCDGFRVDMASSLVKNSERDGGAALRELWSYYRDWLNKHYPEAVLISEWSHPAEAIPAGFDVDFLIHFNEPPYQHLLNPWVERDTDPTPFFARDESGDICKFLDGYLRELQATRRFGYIALPTGNHDFSRPRFHGREESDLRVIYTMLFSMPGVPFLYYGDEIGMRYFPDWPKKEGALWRGGCRTPMQWDSSSGADFSTGPQINYYLPLDPDPLRPNVATQEQDDNSLLNFTRRLIALRHENMSLGNLGGFEPLFAEKNRFPLVYRRTGGTRDFIVAINPTSSRQACTIAALSNAKPAIKNGNFTIEGSKLLMPPVSSAIFEIPPK